jgi:hypothetical protein
MEQLHDRNETLCCKLLTGHPAGLLPRRRWPPAIRSSDRPSFGGRGKGSGR